MPPPVPRCDNCVYYKDSDEDPTSHGYPRGTRIGECHSDRPVMSPHTGEEHWSWPIVPSENTTVCHDYKKVT